MPQYAEPWKAQDFAVDAGGIRIIRSFRRDPDCGMSGVHPMRMERCSRWRGCGCSVGRRPIFSGAGGGSRDGRGLVSSGLRLAWHNRVEMRATLGQL